MSDLRIGLIGSGGMASRNAEIFSQTPGYKLVGIAARNPDTGPALAQKHNVPFTHDWETYCDRDDIDAIVISTNNSSHGEMILAALETNTHIFCEYPIARNLDEIDKIDTKLATSQSVIRVSHSEPLSASHQGLKNQAFEMGQLLSCFFTRLTPGRGARPEALFNLPLTGPPSLFFVYHIYPLVDIFGPVAWVKAGAEYDGLQENGQYHRFVNSVVAGFKNGGLAQWNWAGGIEIENAEEFRRIILTKGTLIHIDDAWHQSTPQGTEPIAKSPTVSKSLAELFLTDIQGQTDWRRDTQVAMDAAKVGLAAEKSVLEKSRVQIN